MGKYIASKKVASSSKRNICIDVRKFLQINKKAFKGKPYPKSNILHPSTKQPDIKQNLGPITGS